MNQPDNSRGPQNRRAVNTGVMIALGAGVGAAIGAAIGNLAVGLGIGLAVFSLVGLFLGQIRTN